MPYETIFFPDEQLTSRDSEEAKLISDALPPLTRPATTADGTLGLVCVVTAAVRPRAQYGRRTTPSIATPEGAVRSSNRPLDAGGLILVAAVVASGLSVAEDEPWKAPAVATPERRLRTRSVA